MFAQCPQCEAIFRVSDEQIAAANGQVRCGQCLSIFNALEHTREDLRTRNIALNGGGITGSHSSAMAQDEQWPDDKPLFHNEPVIDQDNEEQSNEPATQESAPQTEALADDTQPETQNQAKAAETEIPTVILQDLQDAREARQRPSNLPWLLGSMVLVILLGAQAVYFQRDELGRDPRLRPWLNQACELIGCRLAAPFDIKQIELVGLDVHSHPQLADTLVASTAIINRASFMQPYPLLTLTFSDITGSRVAQRRFTPEEYLHADLKPEDGMTPNLPVKIELELADPGAEAVNFEFQLFTDPRNLLAHSK